MKSSPNKLFPTMKLIAKLHRFLLIGGSALALITLFLFHRMTLCPSTTVSESQVASIPRSIAAISSGSGNHSSSTVLEHTERQRRCNDEFRHVMAGHVPGLTQADLERSMAYRGNQQRLSKLVQKLRSRREPVTAVVCGGSITLGHGTEPVDARYSGKLEDWFNEKYPLQQDSQTTKLKHIVYNRGSHGADMCAMAKRMNFLRVPTVPDLFVLEFAVNDYQGQDHVMYLDEKEDVFFDGFEKIAGCAEAVVYRLLYDYPDAAVIFLEFQTANLNRRTAQLLHMGVAQHYKVPVLSYADVIAPGLSHLFDLLGPYDYSIPPHLNISTMLPYPHGCARCRLQDMTEQFRVDGCWTLCQYAEKSGYYRGNCNEREGNTLPCYVPFFDHDEVHPSGVGHRVARDLIAHLIAQTSLSLCNEPDMTWEELKLPAHAGWLVGGRNYQKVLREQTDFIWVQDTMSIFGEANMLLAASNTDGFELKLDNLFRRGWIAVNPKGGESVTFDIDLPVGDCYVIILSVLKSYATVGTFTATVHDIVHNTTTPPRTFDCLWKPRISVPNDVPITLGQTSECSGKCTITVTTNPEVTDGRNGNLIKIISLAVRKCDKN